MSTIYVREQGAKVRRQGERLVVTQGKETLVDLPLLHVTQLVTFGNVQLTAAAVAMLLQAEVDVVFLSQYGKFRGRLVHTGSKFAQLRHDQLLKMTNDKENLAIAGQVVIGKLYNQQVHLFSYRDTAEPAAQKQLQKSIKGIDRLIGKARKARNPDSLRGFEGSAGAHYWAGFKVLLDNTYGFMGRKYFPPPDPVNALLSFGYSLLQKDVTAAVQLVGLDPYLGFFHTIDYGRPSLALDMMEEFRPVLVDPVVVSLINTKQITDASFEKTTNPKLPVRLKDGAMDVVIQAYEEQLSRRVHHTAGNGRTSQRRVIELQVRRLAHVVQNQEKRYRPYRWENGVVRGKE